MAAQTLFFTDPDHRKEFFIDNIATQLYPFDEHAGWSITDGVKRHANCYCDRVYTLFNLTDKQRSKLQAMNYLEYEKFAQTQLRDWAATLEEPEEIGC